jgi:hypothetical protein
MTNSEQNEIRFSNFVVCVYTRINGNPFSSFGNATEGQITSPHYTALFYALRPQIYNRESFLIFKWSILVVFCMINIGCGYRVDPPNDEQQASSKHVEAYYWNKSIINSASYWLILYGYIKMHGTKNIKSLIYIYIYIYIYICTCRYGYTFWVSKLVKCWDKQWAFKRNKNICPNM